MMTTIWRISECADLKGAGGLKSAGRWNSRGRPIVYLAGSPAAAMVEWIVHLLGDEGGRLPSSYQLMEISFGEGVDVKPLLADKPMGWEERLELTRLVGDEWLAKGESALALVPSAIVPRTWNFLLNPEHPDAAKLKIERAARERFEDGLFRSGAN